ncbi:class I SAM-dependent methyltransferase [Streptomyces sp. NPDC059002]|uniref:class I SAM-dependent methyltransferase n=1 Tax=Streptomyces sp. NPDC059002 TaxID=3346690 RepID=UPI0036CBF95A
MSDSYEGLSTHYDLIMTSGYYDYDAYARTLLDLTGDRSRLLEVGVGTGLVCERLLDLAEGSLEITGVDHTESMLVQARRRLGDRVRLLRADIRHADIPSSFDVGYSVGGVWYFIHDQENDAVSFGSHLLEDDDNITALRRVHAALKPGGVLALAAQGPHRDYERPLPGGLVYGQEARAVADGVFVKDYSVKRLTRSQHGEAGEMVAQQRCRYRTYTAEQAEDLLEQCGFRFAGVTGEGLFHHFIRL